MPAFLLEHLKTQSLTSLQNKSVQAADLRLAAFLHSPQCTRCSNMHRVAGRVHFHIRFKHNVHRQLARQQMLRVILAAFAFVVFPVCFLTVSAAIFVWVHGCVRVRVFVFVYVVCVYLCVCVCVCVCVQETMLQRLQCLNFFPPVHQSIINHQSSIINHHQLSIP